MWKFTCTHINVNKTRILNTHVHIYIQLYIYEHTFRLRARKDEVSSGWNVPKQETKIKAIRNGFSTKINKYDNSESAKPKDSTEHKKERIYK